MMCSEVLDSLLTWRNWIMVPSKRSLHTRGQQKCFARAIWDNLDKMTATLKKTLAEGFAKGAGVQRMAKVLNDEFK